MAGWSSVSKTSVFGEDKLDAGAEEFYLSIPVLTAQGISTGNSNMVRGSRVSERQQGATGKGRRAESGRAESRVSESITRRLSRHSRLIGGGQLGIPSRMADG